MVVATCTFEVEGDPDPVGAGAEPFAVEDRLPRCRHGCLLLLQPKAPSNCFSLVKIEFILLADPRCDMVDGEASKEAFTLSVQYTRHVVKHVVSVCARDRRVSGSESGTG